MPSTIALTGLNAAYRKLSTTANNVANVATPGFKSSRVDTVSEAGGGVKVSQVTPQLSQGTSFSTNSSFDLAISGQGFFRLNDNGDEVFSRSGAFSTDREGYITNASGQHLMGVDAEGKVAELKLPTAGVPPTATSKVDLSLNLDANANVPAVAFNPDDSGSYNHKASLTTFDSLGSEHQLDLYFSKTATPGQSEVRAFSDGAQVLPATGITFDAQGRMSSPASGVIEIPSFNSGNGADDTKISLSLKGSTQYGSDSQVNKVSQDGAASSGISGFSIGEDGKVTATTASGQEIVVGQLTVANFPSEHALAQQGNSSFAASEASGAPVFGFPKSGNAGSIQAGALENSNVNLEEQFVSMKMAGQEVGANAAVIKAENTMLGTLFNAKA